MSSPGVSVSYELPNFSAIQTAPIGIPPGVIGTSVEGPAFVPVLLGSIDDFQSIFGQVRGEHFGTLAVNEWYKYQSSAVYMRILGVGNGERRIATATTDDAGENVSAGSVKHAGFIVGTRQVNANGFIGNNPYAMAGGPMGRTYFLGAFMSESAGITTFSDAGIQIPGTNNSAPILRGILFAASGVIPALSGCYTGNVSTASSGIAQGSFASAHDGGSAVGSIDLNAANYNFVLLLNGHKHTTEYPNTITASLNPQSSTDGINLYISASLNTDPTKLQEAGHYLYSHYFFRSQEAVITGSGIVTAGTEKSPALFDNFYQESVFLITGSMARNQDDSTTLNIPNFENFCDRFQPAFSPTVISQKQNRIAQDLFTIHVLDDGAIGNEQLKVTIKNLTPSSIQDGYGQFDLQVRKFGDDDLAVELMGAEEFIGLNLDPSSDSYIARRIGDMHTYFDFDKKSWSQKIVKDGIFGNLSAYIRVKMNKSVERKETSPALLPVGFRGPYHLVTSGSDIMSLPQHPLTDGSVIAASTEWSQRLIEPPIPYRKNLSRLGPSGAATSLESNSNYCWGLKTEQIRNGADPNSSNVFNPGIASYCKYFPMFSTKRKSMFAGENRGTLSSDGTVYDSDRFNNNLFSLENIQVHTTSATDGTDIIDTSEWAFANYRRNGVLERQIKANGTMSKDRFLNPLKDFNLSGVRNFLSFTMPIQAGFDGTNIFNPQKVGMTGTACTWEMNDSAQGGKKGPTVSAYRHALNLIAEKSETDIQLLAIPGIRDPYITMLAVETVEEHFNALYLMDLEEYDVENNVVTSSEQIISIQNTKESFRSRIIGSSFTATFFPDIKLTDPNTGSPIFVPPSVAVLGALGNNDSVGHPWTAPVGYTRGVLNDSIELKVKYLSGSATAVEELYDVGINPIISSTSGLLIYGQKTLMTPGVGSALERINVRRLLIDLRRRVRQIAKSFIFEQNRETTLTRFENAVNPILTSIQSQAGIERYKVTIDSTTTSQADIENNIVRGKIYLQPMRSEEFVYVEFDTE
jgi:hypothetical protein